MADTINAVAQAVQATQATEQTAQAEQAKPAAPNYEELLAKKERQWQAKIREMQAKLQGYEGNYVPKAELSKYISRDQLLTDPLSVLSEAGLTPELISQYALSSTQPKDPVVMQLQNKIKQLEDKLSESSKAAETAAAHSIEQVRKQMKQDVAQLVYSNDSYETIKAANATDAVVELIEQTYEREGYVMDYDKAAEQVENYLLEEALKLAKLSKIQSRLSSQEQSNAPASAQGKQTQPISTLSNKMPQAPSARSKEQERIQRAIAAFNGNKIK